MTTMGYNGMLGLFRMPLSHIILVSLYFHDCFALDFNDQLMPRITERLDEFFGLPIELVRHYLKYLERDDFTKSVDRTSIFKDLFAQTITALEFGVSISTYFSMEDGMVIWAGIDSGEVYFGYREPGYAGYDVASIQPQDPNFKYWVSCFDSTNGTQQNCRMEEGEEYIECVNKCELIPCPSTINETLSEKANSNILCRNYIIKEVQAGDEFGYIPYVDLCSNRHGEPEQRVGFVAKNVARELGSCYFGDKITLVSHNLTGDYVACGGNGAICDNAFHGAFTQFQYDPRYRPFHRSMKELLKPRWSEPSFYVGSFYLAMGYDHPIFSTPFDDGTIIDKKVFEGIASANYELFHITEFLKHEYFGSEFQVLIVERNSPHYTIATSYHEVQFQLKAVLVSDETQPCPDKTFQEFINNSSTSYDFDTELCNIVRIPISDMKDSISSSDVVSYRAFIAHQNKNFPTNSVVYLKLTDDIGSPAYVSQGKLYQLPQSDNAEWHVIAIQQMSRATNDAALPGDLSFGAICLVGSLGFIGCLALLFQFYNGNGKTEQAIVQSDWRLTFLFMLGSATLNLSSFTLLGENTDPTCMLRMWAFNGLLACALSPLLAKVWLMEARRFTPNSTLEGTERTNCTTFLYMLPLIVVQLFILMIFSISDPPRQTEQLGAGAGVGVQQITCEQQANDFLYTQIIVYGFLILMGCVSTYRTRDLDVKFGEAKTLGFCLYNIAFSGSVTIAAVNLIDLDQESQRIIQTVGIFWATFFCNFSFVLPNVLKVKVKNSYAQVGSSRGSQVSSTRNKCLSQRESESEVNSRFDFSGLEMIQEENEPGEDS